MDRSRRWHTTRAGRLGEDVTCACSGRPGRSHRDAGTRDRVSARIECGRSRSLGHYSACHYATKAFPLELHSSCPHRPSPRARSGDQAASSTRRVAIQQPTGRLRGLVRFVCSEDHGDVDDPPASTPSRKPTRDARELMADCRFHFHRRRVRIKPTPARVPRALVLANLRTESLHTVTPRFCDPAVPRRAAAGR